MNTVFICNRFV